MSFQDELRKNIKTKEEAEQSEAEKIYAIAKYEAEKLIKDIRAALIKKANDGDYQSTEQGTLVVCTCPLPQRYVRKWRLDNNAQIIANNRKLLFKNRNLIYQTWYKCDVAIKYEEEFKQLTVVLKDLAKEDNLDLRFVIYDNHDKTVYPFPIQIEGFHLECDLILSVEAKTLLK